MPPVNGVKIQLGGKQRRLRFTTLALMRLEEETGRDTVAVMSLAETSVASTVSLVWAGLLHEQPDLRPYQVAEMIPVLEIKKVRESLAQAIAQAFGTKEGEATNEGNAQAAD